MCDSDFYYHFRVLELVSNSWNNFFMKFIFWPIPGWGDYGWVFRWKKKSKKRLEIHTSQPSFICWFRILYQFYLNYTLSNQKLPNICQKQPKSRLWASIRWTFLSGQCFFIDVFISFYSAWKVLSNHMKTNLVGNQTS